MWKDSLNWSTFSAFHCLLKICHKYQWEFNQDELFFPPMKCPSTNLKMTLKANVHNFLKYFKVCQCNDNGGKVSTTL